MTRIREEVKLRAKQLKIGVQPFLILIGTLEDIQDVYVCIDDVLYKANGVLHGLDICFKSFYVFNLKYPMASEHIWLLIQKGIYRINFPTDPQPASIQAILKRLNDNNSLREEIEKED